MYKKVIDKNPTCVCVLKFLEKVGLKGTGLNIIKAIYEKLTANSILNDENMEAVH